MNSHKPRNPLSPPSTGSLLSSVTEILRDFEVADGSTALGGLSSDIKDLFAEKRRKSWTKDIEARCDFDYRPRMTKRAGVWFLSLWAKSIMGRTLTEIKADPAEVNHFAEATSRLIEEILGGSLKDGGWCLCTTPKRRHKERNFATLICLQMADKLQIPFYEDVAFCKNRQRINAVFTLNVLPKEPNIIVFDDFVTTGSTLKAMQDLLTKYDKTLLFAAGINNSM